MKLRNWILTWRLWRRDRPHNSNQVCLFNVTTFDTIILFHSGWVSRQASERSGVWTGRRANKKATSDFILFFSPFFFSPPFLILLRLRFRASQLTSHNREKRFFTLVFRVDFDTVFIDAYLFDFWSSALVVRSTNSMRFFIIRFSFWDFHFPLSIAHHRSAPIKHLTGLRKRNERTNDLFYLFSSVWQQITDENVNLFQVSSCAFMFSSISASHFNQIIINVNCTNELIALWLASGSSWVARFSTISIHGSLVFFCCLI